MPLSVQYPAKAMYRHIMQCPYNVDVHLLSFHIDLHLTCSCFVLCAPTCLFMTASSKLLPVLHHIMHGMNPIVFRPCGSGGEHDPPTIISMHLIFLEHLTPSHTKFFSNFMFSWHWPGIVFPKKNKVIRYCGGGGGGGWFNFFFLAF